MVQATKKKTSDLADSLWHSDSDMGILLSFLLAFSLSLPPSLPPSLSSSSETRGPKFPSAAVGQKDRKDSDADALLFRLDDTWQGNRVIVRKALNGRCLNERSCSR